MSDDEADAMRSLISWLDRIAPDRRAPLQLLFEAGDTELTQGVRQLEARLFANAGNGSHGDAGSGKKLYQAVANAADLSGRETVLDCYCGIGAIGQYLSRFAEKIVGIESSTSAIEDALKSAGKNKIANISFYKGTAEHILEKQLVPSGKYKFDTVILNPPRAGLHKKVIPAVLAHEPEKIVYVSCNTSTFARDLGEFLKAGYELRMVQPIDLFPHTAHVETVALLQKG